MPYQLDQIDPTKTVMIVVDMPRLMLTFQFKSSA
jgi:hypothetical protein